MKDWDDVITITENVGVTFQLDNGHIMEEFRRTD